MTPDFSCGWVSTGCLSHSQVAHWPLFWDSLFGGHLDKYSSIENRGTMGFLSAKVRAQGTVAAFAHIRGELGICVTTNLHIIQTLTNLVGEASWLEHLRLIRLHEKGLENMGLPLRDTAVPTVKQATSRGSYKTTTTATMRGVEGLYRDIPSRRRHVQTGEAVKDSDS
jgi:hypothetical protein